MTLRINSVAPDFTAETTQGTISLHDYLGDGWGVEVPLGANAVTYVCDVGRPWGDHDRAQQSALLGRR